MYEDWLAHTSSWSRHAFLDAELGAVAMSRVRFLLSVANRFSFRGLVIGVVMAVLDALRAAGRGDARAFASSEPRARLLTGDEASIAVVKKEKRDANTVQAGRVLGGFGGTGSRARDVGGRVVRRWRRLDVSGKQMHAVVTPG